MRAIHWIKIENSLPAKPEVKQIAEQCQLGPYDALGRLVTLFCWYDSHQAEVRQGVFLETIDSIVQHTGFGEAMIAAGWLNIKKPVDNMSRNMSRYTALHVTLPDLHISKIAKQRATNHLRQQRRRSGGVTSADKASIALFTANPKHVTLGANSSSKTVSESVPVPDQEQAQSLPAWLPADAWAAFVAMRKQIRKPLTDHAVDLAIARLAKFRALGHDVREILENSTIGSYQGLFEPRSGSQKSSAAQLREDFSDRDYRQAATKPEDISWMNHGQKSEK